MVHPPNLGKLALESIPRKNLLVTLNPYPGLEEGNEIQGALSLHFKNLEGMVHPPNLRRPIYRKSLKILNFNLHQTSKKYFQRHFLIKRGGPQFFFLLVRGQEAQKPSVPVAKSVKNSLFFKKKSKNAQIFPCT